MIEVAADKFKSFTIHKGDMVQVIGGKEKGKTGKTLKVLKTKNRIIIEGLNMVKRHTKPNQKNPQGGMVEKEASIHYSNVLLLCPKCNKGVRVKASLDKSKKKQRACSKCSTVI